MAPMRDAPGGPWNHAFVSTPEGIRLHYVHAGPADGLPVVLVHGWPDLWFGWRRQIPALESRYRVIVPDLRGFGQSSTPREVTAYGAKNITTDLAHLLDALDIEKAVFIGHDWGGAMVWRMCLYHPTRVLAVAGICTPYHPPNKKYVDLDTAVAFIPAFEYQKFLADSVNAARVLDSSPRRLFTAMYRRFNEFPSKRDFKTLTETLQGVKDSPHPTYTTPSTLLTEDELAYYAEQFAASGFESSCNYYATRKIDFDNERGLPTRIEMPALFVGAARDAVLAPSLARKMPQFIPKLQTKIIEDAGHWVLWEQTDQVNAILIEWLDGLRRSHKDFDLAQSKL